MNNERIKIDVPLGTPLCEIEFSAIEQSVALCEGNRQRAARRLDITVTRVNRFLKKFARSEAVLPARECAPGGIDPT